MQAGVQAADSYTAAHAKVQNWVNTTEVDYMQHDIFRGKQEKKRKKKRKDKSTPSSVMTGASVPRSSPR